MGNEPLARRIAPLPDSPAAASALARLNEAAAAQQAGDALAAALSAEATRRFLGTALGDCPYLLDLAAKDAGRLAAILGEAPEALLAREIGGLRAARWATKAEAMAALRQAKQAVALGLGLADLGGAIDLDAVTAGLTDFADAAVDAALGFALDEARRQGKWLGGGPADCGLALLAMGKYGAHELNYSSDIDLIALYEPEAGGLPEGGEPSVFWVRIVRQIVALLQERTADGYVFRVDLRLRPDPGATAVALSLPAALLYYESMGQNWERAALIKARACAGDKRAGEAFLAEIAPFIWRKYLDFAAIADIHSIKRQVHAHRGHAAVRVLGHDIKRGRGGIREIEFFAQTQQLIAGGRDRALRGGRTRDMLAMLARRNWIGEAARDGLDAAYVFLRRLEHRLQMVRDEQTHTMPADRDGLARIARLMGEADVDRFETAVRETLEGVARRYSQLFEEAPALSGETGSLVFTGGDDDPDTLETLRRLGFREPERVTAAVRAWHFGRFPATRSTAARERLTELTPALLEAFARGGNPDAGFNAFDALLRALPAGVQLFAILASNRQLLDLLALILGAAPRLAETFARRPHVVDALLDPGFFAEAAQTEPPAARLAAGMAEARDYEDALNRVRLFAAEQRFLVSVRLVSGSLGPAAAGEAFSDLAEAAVAALDAATVAEFRRQHGTVPGGSHAIVAFGRLGSREMTAGSDLDLLVVYDHDPDAAASDGPRPLPPSQYYTRLTQRLVAALSAPTAEGVAYAVDLRLRPSGRAGPLATHIEAFRHYQANEAWAWEHLALARARPICGDAGPAAAARAAIAEALARPREPAALAGDIAAMRDRVDENRGARTIWELKTAPGGLMDCEFAAQFLVLRGLAKAEGEPTAATLWRAAAAGAVERQSGACLAYAAALQGAVLQTLRVADDRPFDPAAAPEGMKQLVVRTAQAGIEEFVRRHAEAGEAFAEFIVPTAAGNPAADTLFAAFEAHLEGVQERARAAFRRTVAAAGP